MTDNHTPPAGSPFADIAIGSVVTQFGEKVKRVHHGVYDDPQPSWFKPREKPTQGAQHLNGFSVYWEVTPDWKAREAEHPFAERIAAHAQHIAQLRLL